MAEFPPSPHYEILFSLRPCCIRPAEVTPGHCGGGGKEICHGVLGEAVIQMNIECLFFCQVGSYYIPFRAICLEPNRVGEYSAIPSQSFLCCIRFGLREDSA